MLFESARQTPLFLVFITAGILLGAVYDAFYIFRQKRYGVFTFISDIIFSLIFLILMLFLIQCFNSGKVHLFMFFAVLLGFWAERATLGFFIKIFIDFFIKFLYNLYIRINAKRLFAFLKK
ncbi:MAG: spore cortex biosynthesis protein YabQ [Clostridia bacterium]|jgi:hypothetical protein|nr:spore cortex biosynthesis protein YabQ [Clostridia bacterium]